jgi:hypothetical protein
VFYDDAGLILKITSEGGKQRERKIMEEYSQSVREELNNNTPEFKSTQNTHNNIIQKFCESEVVGHNVPNGC